MGKYVCDEICTLALDGIRCVIGKNVHYDHGPYWQLEVAYKGVVKNIGYPTKEARDAMYKKIVTHLCPALTATGKGHSNRRSNDDGRDLISRAVYAPR